MNSLPMYIIVVINTSMQLKWLIGTVYAQSPTDFTNRCEGVLEPICSHEIAIFQPLVFEL